MNKLIKWWMTPEFPEVHLKDDTSLIKKWFFHPIKRRLAKSYLKFLQKFTDIKVIGITGSAGKTTTKEILASILKLEGVTNYSVANIDPIYNIPTTILRTKFGTKYLILEMGIEYLEEMDFYLWLAKPDIGVITNIYPTHLEFLKSEDNIFFEKSKLVKSLDSNAVAILNHEDPKLRLLKDKINAKMIWVKGGKDPFTLDGYLASYAANELGVSVSKIKKGLNLFKKPPHRMNWIQLSTGAMVFDDSYNSNPEALKASLKLFLKKAKLNNKIAILGDMLELGENEVEYHTMIGEKIAKNNFQVVIGVGKLIKNTLDQINKDSQYTKTYHLTNLSDVFKIVNQYLIKGNYIFIKGSHSIGLDRLVDKLV